MRICEYCGKEHDGSYGSGRFCGVYCARLFSKKFYKPKKIIKQCKYCGRDVEVNLGISDENVVCEYCKDIYMTHKVCKICGRKYRHRCSNDFCKHHNIQQIKTLIKYFGFDESKLGTSDIENEFNRIRNILYKDYWVDGLTSTQLGEKYKYPSPCNFAGKIFKYLGIPTRTLKEASDLTKFTAKRPINPHKFYKNEWHTTWDNNEVFLRSSYETEFANQLDAKKIHYEVESLRIKYWDSQENEYRCAIPDFYVPETNTIYEIKSNYTYDRINMIDRFKAYKELGYKTILVLEHKEFEI